ncbi:MAG: hypothetical protein DRJ18_02450 [Candidatus Methanomethylicota archaeon]|nr:hypothetical protein [Candidatus Culexmicrobium cathedralense]RLE48119.1 MAG: hypothetical protein DRJ18_02450 [Candidatus Verstraetearchaeota archaeon]
MIRAQAYAIASLVLSLLVLITCVVAIQPLTIKNVKVGEPSYIENLNLELRRLVKFSLSSSSRFGDASIIIGRLIEFQNFVDQLARMGYNVHFNWRGGLGFSWNCSFSITQANFKFEIECDEFKVVRVFSYVLQVNVTRAAWINGSFTALLEVLVNGFGVKVAGCEVFVLYDDFWVKLNSSDVCLDRGIVRISFPCSVPPKEFYAIVVDEHGVLVRVKCPVYTES